LKKILYTTIFGGYDDITTPKLPRDWDWKCFTEKNSIPLYSDNTRNAKKFKILPHRYLQDYEYSIFIDGNYVAWKNKTKFNYMEGDSRNNEYFTRDTKPHKGSK
jgi:hypothetical protein